MNVMTLAETETLLLENAPGSMNAVVFDPEITVACECSCWLFPLQGQETKTTKISRAILQRGSGAPHKAEVGSCTERSPQADQARWHGQVQWPH